MVSEAFKMGIAVDKVPGISIYSGGDLRGSELVKRNLKMEVSYAEIYNCGSR